MSGKILFVDDEPLVLDGYKRMLHNEFDVSTALGGEHGLLTVQDNGPYAVVISDMRMPDMNGAQFLAQLRQKAPDTVRMLLTGYTDVEAAIEAINEGNIFRFLTKPCEKQILVAAINLGLIQYRSVRTGNELVKKALALEEIKETEDSIAEIAADDFQWDNFQGPTGLPGPTQAQEHLAPLFGTGLHHYVVLFKLGTMKTIGERYGEEAVCDYLNFAAQSLMQILKSDDRLFHWRRDVLMAVVQRQNALFSIRLEMARLTSGSREYLINVDGKCLLISSPMTFELLALSQYASLDDMLTAINAKLIGHL